MTETNAESESPRERSVDEDNVEDNGDEKGTKKPGSKEKGRKRTKTGCLSQYYPSLTISVKGELKANT